MNYQELKQIISELKLSDEQEVTVNKEEYIILLEEVLQYRRSNVGRRVNMLRKGSGGKS